MTKQDKEIIWRQLLDNVIFVENVNKYFYIFVFPSLNSSNALTGN